jgi:hypothetical protein
MTLQEFTKTPFLYGFLEECNIDIWYMLLSKGCQFLKIGVLGRLMVTQQCSLMVSLYLI